MVIYQKDNGWYVKTEGGYINRDIIPSEGKGPFTAKPTPVVKWQEEEKTEDGRGRKVFTQFAAPEGKFTVVEFKWYPAWGYSWEEEWEMFAPEPIVPPVLGEAYYWTGEGWEPMPHPMEVEA